MDERDALLKALCENPDEDTPRLVYADWLQEHGDETRAEFIRAQVRHGELLRNADPGAEDSARQARALWLQFGAKWRADLPQLKGVRWHDAFFRGFVERVVVPSDAVLVAHAQTVFDLVPIRHLEIEKFAAVDGFDRLACVRRLKTLAVAAADPDGAVLRRLVTRVRLDQSTLLIVQGGLSGNDKYPALREAFGDQLYWRLPR
jgi:uncharacterized protein (TIGR02996 family)